MAVRRHTRVAHRGGRHRRSGYRPKGVSRNRAGPASTALKAAAVRPVTLWRLRRWDDDYRPGPEWAAHTVLHHARKRLLYEQGPLLCREDREGCRRGAAHQTS